MRRHLTGFTAVLAVLAVLALAAPASALEPTHVISGDQAARVGAMLGIGGGELGGCTLDKANIDKTVARATYTCAAGAAELTLAYPDVEDGVTVRSEKFAIVAGTPAPPRELVDAVLARVKEGEAGFSWEEALPGQGDEAQSFAPSVPLHTLVGATAEQQAKYDKAVALYEQGKAEESYRLLFEIAKDIHVGVLGTLVAALASSHPTPALVEELGARAEAAPDDALANFVAGVAAHYYGHQSGQTRAEKSEYYKKTIRWLERTRDAYPREARVWIYLAVSYYRTGEQQKAEELIEKAVALGRHDADAFYCRAEIWHEKDPAKAVTDMKAYLEIMEENRRRGAFWSDDKETRVKDMIARMERVVRGEIAADAADLFDPIHERFTAADSTSTVAGLVAGVALVLVGVVALLRRRRRKS